MSDPTYETTDAPDEAVEAVDGEAPDEAALLGTAYPEDDEAPDEAPDEVSEPPAAEPVGTGSIIRGHRGERVEALQAALVAAGHEVAIDGYYGTLTGRAVKAYQAAQGFAVTGAVGESTAAALGI
jgi:peptidoglycan hydrolase-like protein with peptidoglycan-binding domain